MKGYQRSLLIDSSPLQVLPELAKAIGLNEAILLQQVHYWVRIKASSTKNEDVWIYKSVQEWQEEFPFWSEATIKRVVVNLRDLGLLEIRKESDTSWNRVNYYTVNYEGIGKLNLSIGSICTNALDQIDPMHQVNLTQSIGSNCTNRSDQSDPMSNIRQENTSETTAKKRGAAASRPPKPKKKPLTPMPPDFYISDDVREWAKGQGFEPYLEAHLAFFRDQADAKQYQYAEWDKAFMNCIRADWGGVRKQFKGVPPKTSTAGAPAAPLLEVEAEWQDGRTKVLTTSHGDDHAAIAKQVLHQYSRTLGNAARYINVRIPGGSTSKFSVEELRSA